MEQQQGKPQAQGSEGTTLFYCQSEKDAGSRCLTVCDYCNKLGTSLPPSPSIEAIKYDYWKILHCWKWELDELLGPMWYQETLSGESEMITTEQLYDRYKQTTPTSPLPASSSVKVEEQKVYFVINIQDELPDKAGWYNCYAGDEFLGNDYYSDGKFKYKHTTHWLKAGFLAASPKGKEEDELKELRAWKESAMRVMPDFQAIGKELGLKLGDTVHDKILPAIINYKKQLGITD